MDGSSNVTRIIRYALALPILAYAVSAEPTLAAAVLGMLPLAVTVSPQHPTRERIMQHLRMLPGDHLRSIARVLRLGVSEARYHLHVLGRSGLVREEKVRHRSRFYPADAKSEADRNLLFRKHWVHRDLRVRVLHAVKVHGSVRPAQVAKTIGISRQLATYHLSHLTAAGEVVRQGPEYRWPAASPEPDRLETADMAGPQFPR